MKRWVPSLMIKIQTKIEFYLCLALLNLTMVPSILANGRMACAMVRANSTGTMALFMKGENF
jgi:hypothetical protein